MFSGGLSHRVGNRFQVYPAPVFAAVTVGDLHGNSHPKLWEGLVDTGSGRTIVPVQIPLRLALTPSGYVRLSGFERSRSQALYPEYEVQFAIDGLGSDIEIVACGAGSRSYILLGRDFINQYVLLIDGPASRWRMSRSRGLLGLLVRAFGVRR